MKKYKPQIDHKGKLGLIKKLPYTEPPERCKRGKELCGHCREFTGFGGGYFCHYSLDTDKLRGKVEDNFCPYYTDKRCLTTDNFKVIRDKTMPVPREISVRIRYLRAINNETQIVLSKAIGISQVEISKWESGRMEPKVSSIIKLCNHFNVSADWLLGLSDYKSIRR